MRRTAITLVALVALAGADAAAAQERCKLPKRAKQLAASSYTRVYETSNFPEGPGPTYACNRRTGRRFKLDDPDRDFQAAAPILAGTHMAYLLFSSESEVVVSRLMVLDLAAAKKRQLDAWGEEDDELVVDYHLTRTGAIAWSGIADRGRTGEVWLFGESGKTRLDSGPPELAESFAVSSNGARVYWTNAAGEPRTALVR